MTNWQLTMLYITKWLTVDEAGICIRVQPRFAGDKIFRPVTDPTEVTQCCMLGRCTSTSLLLGLVSSCLVVCPLDIGTKHCTLAEFYHGNRDRRSTVIGTAAASVTIGMFNDWLSALNCPGWGFQYPTSTHKPFKSTSRVIKLDLKDPQAIIHGSIVLVMWSRPEKCNKVLKIA